VIKLDRSLAGRRLDVDVEATDKLGRRQLETGVGTLRIG
jgi:hypothetical protein